MRSSAPESELAGNGVDCDQRGICWEGDDSLGSRLTYTPKSTMAELEDDDEADAAGNDVDAPGEPPPELKPRGERPVQRLVEAVGIPVGDSTWTRSRSSHWVYRDGDRIATTLWWDHMRTDAQGIVGWVGTLPRGSGSDRERKRGEREAVLREAHARGIPVQVIIVQGTRRLSPTAAGHSITRTRALDGPSWWVTAINETTGLITLRRGGAIVNGVWVPKQEPIRETRPNGDLELIAQDLAVICGDTAIDETVREELRLARIGQGAFRQALMERWEGKCAVTGCAIREALRASHMLPWAERTPNNAHRLDRQNGLLLVASLDALFDRGLITFEDGGTMRVSKQLDDKELQKIAPSRFLKKSLTEEEKSYLRLHRAMVFKS